MLHEDVNSYLLVLTYIFGKNLQGKFPNVTNSLRAFMCMPISVASAEGNFSKPKLKKCYLWSIMCEERLTGLAGIAIDCGIAHSLDTE
jgi:hypothetical protein